MHCMHRYASITGNWDGTISLNPYAQFVEDVGLANASSKLCKKADLDRTFIAADAASNKLDDAGVNRKGALSMDEFVYCLGMIASMRHLAEPPAESGGGPAPCADLSQAVGRLFSGDLLRKIDGVLLPDPNEFRREVV